MAATEQLNDSPTPAEKVDAALAIAEQGGTVFPCKPNKAPYLKNGFYDASDDEDLIRWWFSEKYPDALIGLRTGEVSGIFVLDVDNGEEGLDALVKLEAENSKLPSTYTTRTPGNVSKGKWPGEQRYFTYPGTKVKSTVSRLGTNLDVRGDGGYVIVPPSRGYSVSEGEYGVFATAPPWLIELVSGDGQDGGGAGEIGEAIPEGQRNAGLASMAGSMRLRGMSKAAILAGLWEENQIKCNPPLPWHEVAAIAASVARYTPGSLSLTDLGNAERLVGRHGHDLIHVYAIGWFVWDGRRWQKDESGEVDRRSYETIRSIHEEAARVPSEEKRTALGKWAKASESASRISSTIKLAKSLPGIPAKANALDTGHMLFNVENGTVNLETGTLQEARREDLITKIAPVAFDPDATCPTWEAFLERALPNPATRRYLKRLVGFSLTGKTNEKILPCLLGPGDTGKSTFIETVLALMGTDYAGPAPEDLILAKRGTAHPTELADLLGMRFVPTVEIPEGRYLAESRVKQLTGGDQIKARFMNENFFYFDPTHKLWLAANHEPFLKTGDSAIWNRIKKIPFDVVIPKDQQDKNLKDKFEAEISGILNWAIEGCLEWQREGLGEPEEVREATAEYQKGQDTFGDFIESYCVLGPDERAVGYQLKAAYERWCARERQDPLKWTIIEGRLKGRGCKKQKVRDRSDKNKAKNGWAGIGLREVELYDDDDEGGEGEYVQKVGKLP